MGPIIKHNFFGHCINSCIGKAPRIFLLTCIMGINIANANNPGPMLTINGGWSPWSTVATPCEREINFVMVNVSCGGGKMTRRRSCTNPEPQVKPQ